MHNEQILALSGAAATPVTSLGSSTINSADWNLSDFRFGSKNAPGVLTLRASGNSRSNRAANAVYHVDTGDGVEIGALATLTELERDPLIRASYPALAEAAAIAATPQLRNMATIGGNLLQRPRCWYFRSDHVTCWLRGGDTCYAREGENQHHALFQPSPSESSRLPAPTAAAGGRCVR